MSKPPLPSVGMISLGCPKNLVDAEVMLGHLQREGHEVVSDADARVVLVNTCGFIDRAKEESVETILEQVERKRRARSTASSSRAAWSRSTGGSSRRRFPRWTLRGARRARARARRAAAGLPSLPRFTDKPLATRLYDDLAPRVLSRRRGYAYLKVGEGCDNPCTFCTIPQMRGLQRSRSVESLLAEAQSLEAQGVSELVLISQDTTRYGEDLGMKRAGLARLVGELLARTTFPWIRFLYAYPKTLDESVLRLMAESPRFVPYVDIPLQHVSRPILAAMRRGGDSASYRRLVDRMREIVPEHRDPHDVHRRVPRRGRGGVRGALRVRARRGARQRRRLHVLARAGLRIEPLGDPVPTEEKERRKEFLLSLQQPIARRRLRALRGRTVDAIVEGPSDEHEYLVDARLRSQAPEIDGRVLINDAAGGTLFPGDLVRVRVERTFDYDVVGRIVD